jgi:hypothetical protein
MRLLHFICNEGSPCRFTSRDDHHARDDHYTRHGHYARDDTRG